MGVLLQVDDATCITLDTPYDMRAIRLQSYSPGDPEADDVMVCSLLTSTPWGGVATANGCCLPLSAGRLQNWQH